GTGGRNPALERPGRMMEVEGPGSLPAIPAGDLLQEARAGVDAFLAVTASHLADNMPGRIGTALSYALGTAGKRVRAALVLAAYRSVGGAAPEILGVASAVEVVHTYSLVHDDLPCMDDDDLRRGRPTTHRAVDVPSATLAGYLLVPVAARILVNAGRGLGLDARETGRLAAELFSASGIEGMVGGQWRDLEAEEMDLSLAELTDVHRGKTGALIRAACVLGGMAGRAKPDAVQALAAYGEEIGLAFQIADDVLDVTGTSMELGKTAGRDAALRKSTFVQLMGVESARAQALRLAARAVEHLERGGVEADSLAALARYIVTRKY
ncbi:MAG: polyprenyl synthetase family protein, partial [Gemmatimonadales bacterium]